MGWSYPDIPLPDLMNLIKAFIDILILASGYQSTGRPAYWDTNNIKKAFQWALFLENVSKNLTSSDDYVDSVKELDAALSELTSNCNLPQGIAQLSCVTLGRARDLLLERLVQTLPLREPHLRALLTASVEMDLSQLRIKGNDSLHVYLRQLMQNLSSGSNSSQSRVFVEDSMDSSPSTIKEEDLIGNDFSLPAIRELERRQLAASCSSAVESGLDILSKAVGKNIHRELGATVNAERIKHSSSLIPEEMLVESTVWSRWKSRSLSYMLDKRTIRLVSGASLIFSAPRHRWDLMFEGLCISDESDGNLCEMIELLLLGCVANRWSALIEHLMSVSFKPLTIARLYNDLLHLPAGESRNLFKEEELNNSKERSIMDYLEVLLSNQLHQLWKLSPVAAAVAIPSWSQLFKSYLLELEGQFRRHSSANRCCSCTTDGVEVRECEVAERIWCLHTFHGSSITPSNSHISLGGDEDIQLAIPRDAHKSSTQEIRLLQGICTGKQFAAKTLMINLFGAEMAEEMLMRSVVEKNAVFLVGEARLVLLQIYLRKGPRVLKIGTNHHDLQLSMLQLTSSS